MRYIVDADGYLLSVSFGAQIKCGGVSCTEYTGAVPEGYDSLVDWYTQECEKLYRWMIVSGNLTLDSAAEAPADEAATVDRVIEQGEKDGWTYRFWESGVKECWISGEKENMDFSQAALHSGFYYLNIGLTFPISFSDPPVVVADGGSQDILNFLRVSHVSMESINLWVYSLENIDTDTTVYYHVYVKGI